MTIPLTPEDEERAATFIHDLYQWASKRTAEPDAINRLTIQYGEVHESLGKSGIDMAVLMANADPDLKFIDAFIRAMKKAEDERQDWIENPDFDTIGNLVISPTTFRDGLRKFQLATRNEPREEGAGASREDVLDTLRLTIEGKLIGDQKHREIQANPFQSSCESIYNEMSRLVLDSLLKQQVDEATISKIVRDPVYRTAIRKFSAAAAFERSGSRENERGEFEKWLAMKEGMPEGGVKFSSSAMGSADVGKALSLQGLDLENVGKLARSLREKINKPDPDHGIHF